MQPHDPHQQQQPPYQPQYPPPQPPPPVFVQQPSNKATALGVWAIFLWIAAPAIVLVLCCAGCLFSGAVTSFMEGFNEGVSVSSTPAP